MKPSEGLQSKFTPERGFAFLLKEVGRRYELRFERRAREFSLTLLASRALAVLIRNQGISQKELSALTDIEPMTMVRVLNRLEKMGYITRLPDPKDRRARILRTEPSAIPIVEKIWDLSNALLEEAFAGIPSEARVQLIGTLLHIGKNLED